MTEQLRWGLLGASAITRDFVLAIRRAGLTGHRLVAIASKSSKESAEEMAKHFDIENVYTDYNDIFNSPEIGRSLPLDDCHFLVRIVLKMIFGYVRCHLCWVDSYTALFCN